MEVQILPPSPILTNQPKEKTMEFVGNPNEQFEQVVIDTILSCPTQAEAGPEVVKAVRDWMGRNGIVFYQP
jgi:hypothetical protein